ncbi:hypothetical protein MMC13_001798 [Lambiella insularis]|nr:hypothetical protein [Lambiella insularis]
MITIGAVIEQLQTYDTNNTLEDLLQSPEFITKVTTILESLPTNSKATARKIIYNASGPTKPKTNSALRAILKVKSIALPEAITPVFNECKRSPATFWSSAGLQFDLERHSAKPLTDFVPEVYLGIRSLETRRVWDTILWRYFVLFFHDLATFFNISKITTKLEDYLVVTILAFSGPVRDDTDTIRENIRRWTASGYRYAHLSAAFDDGAPFLLPQSVTDKSWEYELPLTGPSYEKVTEHLSHIGICTESKRIGADVLGSEIRRFILQPFQWMNFSFQVSLLDLTYATDRKSDIDPTQSQHPRQPSYGPTQHVGTEATDIQWNSAPSQEHNTASMDLLTRAAGIIASGHLFNLHSSDNGSYLFRTTELES